MNCKTEPRFKSYDEFTDKDKDHFKGLYKQLIDENRKRNDINGYLDNLGKYGYELHTLPPHNCRFITFKSKTEYGESYDIGFKIDDSRKISKVDPVKGLEEYELKASDDLYWKIIEFIESIIFPSLSGFNRRKQALMMRHSHRAGKRKTYKKKKLRRNRYTRNNKK